MSLIPSLSEIREEILREFDDKEAKSLADTVRPLYTINNQGRHEQIASCILISIEKYKFLVTAAHVIDAISDGKLIIGGENKTINIPSKGFYTISSKLDRSDDMFDYAILEMSDEIFEGAVNLNFIDESRIYDNSNRTKNMFFMALGYPNTKNRKMDHVNHYIQPVPYAYYAEINHDENLHGKVGTTPDTHFLLDYIEQFKDTNGKTINAFKPKGMSGGGLFHVCDLPSVESHVRPYKYDCRLAGMLIEHKSQFNVIVATNIQLVINEIRKRYF